MTDAHPADFVFLAMNRRTDKSEGVTSIWCMASGLRVPVLNTLPHVIVYANQPSGLVGAPGVFL